MASVIYRVTLRLFVAGVPVPQGSKKVVRGRLLDTNPHKLKAWRGAIRSAVSVLHHGEPLAGPVVVRAEFTVPRPVSVRREFPSVRPDVDKYLRAVMDALTEAGVWADDGQVIEAVASKRYGERPGVLIQVGAVEEGRSA